MLFVKPWLVMQASHIKALVGALVVPLLIWFFAYVPEKAKEEDPSTSKARVS